jgi:thiamine-phosphate pyrophosphorylase
MRNGRALPRLHAVTDDEVLGRAGWEAAAGQVLEAGGPDIALHIRGPAVGSRRLLALVTALAPDARRTGASLLVNDRVDVALVAEVDGVHLRGGSLSSERARALVGPDMWIGESLHDIDETAAAAGQGADYAFLGMIFPTASHPGREGLGIAALEAAVKCSKGLPILGIGGIGAGEAAAVVASGAYGVAAIRGIWDAPDPGASVRRYLEVVANRRGQQ